MGDFDATWTLKARRWRNGVTVVLALLIWTIFGAWYLQAEKATDAGMNLGDVGLVHICAWDDHPNPSRLPLCPARISRSSP